MSIGPTNIERTSQEEKNFYRIVFGTQRGSPLNNSLSRQFSGFSPFLCRSYSQLFIIRSERASPEVKREAFVFFITSRFVSRQLFRDEKLFTLQLVYHSQSRDFKTFRSPKLNQILNEAKYENFLPFSFC